MSAKPKPQKSRPATERDPFENWKPQYRGLAKESYLRYVEWLAEGAEALHALELALTKACKVLPTVYRMVIPVTLGSDAGTASLEGRGIDEAEELLVPVFSQLPLLLRKVRNAAEYTDSVVWRQVNCSSDDCPGVAAFVRGNTRLPQILELRGKWSNEIFNAANK